LHILNPPPIPNNASQTVKYSALFFVWVSQHAPPPHLNNISQFSTPTFPFVRFSPCLSFCCVHFSLSIFSWVPPSLSLTWCFFFYWRSWVRGFLVLFFAVISLPLPSFQLPNSGLAYQPPFISFFFFLFDTLMERFPRSTTLRGHRPTTVTFFPPFSGGFFFGFPKVRCFPQSMPPSRYAKLFSLGSFSSYPKFPWRNFSPRFPSSFSFFPRFFEIGTWVPYSLVFLSSPHVL